MLKWLVFSVLWIVGLFFGDALASTAMGGTGSRLTMFGGMWMIVCIAAKECIEGYQQYNARRSGAKG